MYLINHLANGPFLKSRHFDRLVFDHFFQANKSPEKTRWSFQTKETDTHLYYRLEVPGFNKDNIDVSLQEDCLTIQGTQDEQLILERYVSLDTEINESSLLAHIENGILTLSLEKIKQPEPKKTKASWTESNPLPRLKEENKAH